MCERHVLLDTKTANDALGSPLRRQITNTRADRIRGIGEPHRGVIHQELAALSIFGSEDRAAQGFAPGAQHPCKAEHLAGMKLEAYLFISTTASKPPDTQAHHT